MRATNGRARTLTVEHTEIETEPSHAQTQALAELAADVLRHALDAGTLYLDAHNVLRVREAP